MKRQLAACCALTIALAGCASTGRRLPAYVGNGVGSEFGNYASAPAGEMQLPTGERCVLYNWDRPISGDKAIRYTSASCESKEHPGWMTTREISRTVISISKSNLKDEVKPSQ